MLLVMPVYGQLDAPRRWYLEAVRRLRGLGLRQHVLDPCTFLIYEADHGGPTGESSDPDPTFLGAERLCGMICFHVDDMLGAGDPNSEVYNKVLAELRKSFSWKDGSHLEYCGAAIDKSEDGTLKLHHEGYLKKIEPITIAKHLGPESELNNNEITSLRGLLGAIQWPAVQLSPHLQASTSILSGSISRGLVKTALEANRLWKFAKENSDIDLTFAPLRLSEVCLVTAFNASFGCRPDGTSQGGYLVMLAPKRILETEEDSYHILDWRSQKLPRVARSSLAAEAQAAACAADSTEFVCRYFEHLRQPNLSLSELLKEKTVLKPILVTDAKALYDSYHRESLISSATDRRISLEIRVVKEQLQSVAGTMRWVSSEHQLADGLTKESTRQSLGDRLKHSKIKFLWDPDYVAAKKKPLEERNRNLQESSKSRNTKKKKGEKKLNVNLQNDLQNEENLMPIDKNLPPTFNVAQNANVSEYDLVPAETFVLEETFVPEKNFTGLALSDGVIKYVLKKTTDFVSGCGKVVKAALWFSFPTGCLGENLRSSLSGGSYGWLLNLFGWLLVIVITFCCGYLCGCRRERALERQLLESNRAANMFAILVPKLEEALEEAREKCHRTQAAFDEAADNFDRMAQAFHRAVDEDGPPPVGSRNAFTELNALRDLRTDAVHVMRRTQDETKSSTIWTMSAHSTRRSMLRMRIQLIGIPT